MAEDRLDPRDFISPPYTGCPKCGHETFGVLTIDGASYSRRCRDCWHMVNRLPLPKLKKKIIYLDQYVVSNLMKLDHPEHQRNDRLARDTFWTELRELLLALRKMQLICCPNSPSHEVESRISPFNDQLKKTYEALSGGIRFTLFEGIRNQQMAELARAWSEEREPIFEFNPRTVLSKDPDQWSERFYITFGDNPFVIPSELEDSRRDVESHITRLFRDVWSKEKRTFQYWYDLERQEYREHLRKAVIAARHGRVAAIAAFRPGVQPRLENLGKIMLADSEVLLKVIEQNMQFPRNGEERTAEECNELEKSFGEANRIAEAPFVKLQALMFASLAMRAAGGQKELPNAGTNTDIETVAHLLPYCDVMLMDNGCRSLLTDVPSNFRPAAATKVFSPNTREAFLAYLRTIRAAATPEHLAALREVYGEDRCATAEDGRT